jgi:hypothetical protein
MTQRMWARGLAGLCGLLLCAGVAYAQEKKPGEAPNKPDAPKKEEAKKPEAPKAEKPEAGKGQPEMDPAMVEMMKKWQEFATPGEFHKHLEPLVGKWTYEVHWQMSPDAPPTTSKGTGEYKWILDGRYLQQETAGAQPEGPDGTVMKGLGLTGYDNLKKQYFGVWIDNMGTALMAGYGTCDPDGKVITMTGEGSDPMSGKTDQKWRSVLRIESKDKHVFEMYSPDAGGKEFKCMEITYTRAK